MLQNIIAIRMINNLERCRVVGILSLRNDAFKRLTIIVPR